MIPGTECAICVMLNYFSSFLYSLTQENFTTQAGLKPIGSIHSVTDFYSKIDSLPSGTPIKLYGTFSNFIPLLPGKASIKRDLHLEFRNNIDNIKELFNKRRFHLQNTTINYLLSLTAGQMIVRPIVHDTMYIPCALYESIARNSILLLVPCNLYKIIQKKINKKSLSNDFAEAQITGYVDRVQNTFAQNIQENLFKIKEVKKTIDLSKFRALNNTAVIRMENKSGSFKQIGATRFLDGDIWIAIRKQQNEDFITRFLNLSDPSEMQNLTKDLITEYRNSYSTWDITGVFDPISKEAQSLNLHEFSHVKAK